MQSHKWRQVGTNKRGIASLKESKRSRHGVQAPHLLNEYHYANEAALGSNAAPLQDVALRDWTIVNVPWLFFFVSVVKRGETAAPAPNVVAAAGTIRRAFHQRRPVCKASSVDDTDGLGAGGRHRGFRATAEWLHPLDARNKWSRPMVASWAGSEVGRKRIVAESFDLVNRISAISPSGRLKCQAKEEGHCVSHGSPHELI